LQHSVHSQDKELINSGDIQLLVLKTLSPGGASLQLRDFLRQFGKDSALPTLDNLRNFLFTTTTEVLIFFQQLREAP